MNKPLDDWSKEELVTLVRELLLFMYEIRDDAHNRELDMSMYLDRRGFPDETPYPE